MTAINTGPTATALHHLLAYLHAVTGLDPLWLLGAVMATSGLVLLIVFSVVEDTIRRRTNRRRFLHPTQW